MKHQIQNLDPLRITEAKNLELPFAMVEKEKKNFQELCLVSVPSLDDPLSHYLLLHITEFVESSILWDFPALSCAFLIQNLGWLFIIFFAP